MTDMSPQEVLYRLIAGGDTVKNGEIETWLAGGGSLRDLILGSPVLASAHVGAAFGTTSTTGAQVPLSAITFDVPGVPFFVKFGGEINMSAAGRAYLEVRDGATVVAKAATPVLAAAANDIPVYFEKPVPNVQYTPTGQVTLSLWLRTSAGTATLKGDPSASLAVG